MQTKEKIVVVGFGWVGQANAVALHRLGYPVSFFDPGKPDWHYADLYKADYKRLKALPSPLSIDSEDTWYIVCVGDKVSEDGVQDVSLIEKALESLRGVKGKVILRSTLLPDTVDRLSYDFYLPEFLHEKKAVEECVAPYYFVVGQKSVGVREPSFFEEWEKRGFKTFRGTPREAAHIKYLSNLWNALRIAFMNEYGCSITEPSSSAKVADIERVMRFIFEDKPYRRFGRSYGGHCLPKDSRAYARWADQTGKNTPLLKSMIVSNDVHRMQEQKYPHLHEWFSSWERPEGSGTEALKELVRSVGRNIRHPLSFFKRWYRMRYRA